MKTAYELAMERLNKASPSVSLTSQQKKELAELESKYAARIAERELALKPEIEKTIGSGDAEKAEELQGRLARERKALQAELEEKKAKIRDLKS